jgi:hypothetical protein
MFNRNSSVIESLQPVSQLKTGKVLVQFIKQFNKFRMSPCFYVMMLNTKVFTS